MGIQDGVECGWFSVCAYVVGVAFVCALEFSDVGCVYGVVASAVCAHGVGELVSVECGVHTAAF